ncbi:MAG: FAD-dependent oxidoreductase [Planctomycetota bacterium]
MTDENIAVIGAGPVGCVLALLLQRRGFRVTVHEKRADMRQGGVAAGRSINLVLTRRGLRALRLLGLEDEVLAITTPVFGRMMHSLAGELTYTPYGKDDRERNHSISRGDLNRFLLDQAEAAGVTLHFERELAGFDPRAGTLRFQDPAGRPLPEVTAARVFGADGAPSAVRAGLVDAGLAEHRMDLLPDGYKELLFPAAPGGGFAMEQRALHIWPRGTHMLMGLPNLDGSFTGTIYMHHEGAVSFAALDAPAAVEAFFAAHYPDAVPLLGQGLGQAFLDSPTGILGTVRCSAWRHADRVLLVGDAAHAVVPFFGQGLNCGFEDCAALDQLLRAGGSDLGAVFQAYEDERKPAGNAIADMALENYVEMRDRVGDPAFILQKRVEQRVEAALAPRYRSRYAMVVYSSIPYHLAREAGELNAGILAELCQGIEEPEQADLARAEALVAERLTPFVAAHGLDLDF